MPELPEVETVRIQLQEKIVGKTIKGVEVFHAKTVGYDETIEDRLVGNVIAGIDRIGKLMIVSFVDESDLFLLAHLKMTGQFFVVAPDGDVTGGGHSMTEADIATFPGRHTRMAMHFADKTTLYFNDMRLFGYVKVADAEMVAQARGGFGPEPIDPDFDTDWFVAAMRKKKALVKAALLDQSFIAGLGNIYVDEALWRAKVRPTRRSNRVTKAEAHAIAKHSGDVMNESIAVGGTTLQSFNFGSFRNTEGYIGNFKQFLYVFGKQGTACVRCGDTITKIRAAGRGTHYCPGCQK